MCGCRAGDPIRCKETEADMADQPAWGDPYIDREIFNDSVPPVWAIDRCFAPGRGIGNNTDPIQDTEESIPEILRDDPLTN